MFLVIRSDAGISRQTVRNYGDASKAVRMFIDVKGLGAGCSDNGCAFHLATIASDDKRTPLATVSYNGRVWACGTGKEITI